MRRRPSADPELPLPASHLRLYGRFWDVVSLLCFGGAAVLVPVTHAHALTWSIWLTVGLVAAQAGLYLLLIGSQGWPIRRRYVGAYFGGGIALWLAASWLTPDVAWLGFTYFGQMFGLLPPPVTVPGTAALTATVLLAMFDWEPNRISLGAGLGFLFQWAAANALFLFITSIIRTSRERGQLVQELEAAQRELEAARQKDLELAALRERERLARDLHDSLGHALVAISVQLEAIQRLYRVDPERGSQHVDELKGLTRRTTDELRRSLAGLRAPGLGDQRLSQALPALCVEVGQRSGLTITCQAPPAADALSPAVAEALWRVAQEALTNVVRHARAGRVTVTLEVRPASVSLTVTDDGVGLPPQVETLPGHFGLRGLRERVEGLGGTLTLPAAGPGTRVEACLPLIAAAGQNG